jgi:hypothetical protein
VRASWWRPRRQWRSCAKGVLVLGLLALFPPAALAAFEFSWPSARSAALAGSEIDLAAATSACILPAAEGVGESSGGTEVGSASGEGGGPAFPHTSGALAIERIEFSAGELYGLPEARCFTARATLASRLGSATLSIGQLGGELYRERTLGGALTRPLAETVAVELGGRLLSLTAEGVAERRAIALDAGIASRLLGRIVVGARWRNVGNARVGGSPVSAGATVGTSLALERIRLSASLDLERDLDPAFAFGCEAEVGEWLRVRAGVAVEPGVFGVGVGIGRECRGHKGAACATPGANGVGSVQSGLLTWPVIDVAVTWHPELGGSSFATVSFCH